MIANVLHDNVVLFVSNDRLHIISIVEVLCVVALGNHELILRHSLSEVAEVVALWHWDISAHKVKPS